MPDSHELFKELIEKEKNREELNRAVEATPIRDQWRQIIVVSLALLILAGAFASRTKRFKGVMNELERSALVTTLSKVKAQSKAVAQKPLDPATALDSSEQAWTNAKKAGESFSDDDDLSSHRKANEELGAKLESLSSGHSNEPGIPQENVTASPPPNEPELVGISNKTPEPELDAFNLQPEVSATSNGYRELKQTPSAYAGEKNEFPDLQ